MYRESIIAIPNLHLKFMQLISGPEGVHSKLLKIEIRWKWGVKWVYVYEWAKLLRARIFFTLESESDEI